MRKRSRVADLVIVWEMYLLARKDTVSGYAEKLEPKRADSLGRICLRNTEEEAVVVDLLDIGL